MKKCTTSLLYQEKWIKGPAHALPAFGCTVGTRLGLRGWDAVGTRLLGWDAVGTRLGLGWDSLKPVNDSVVVSVVIPVEPG